VNDELIWLDLLLLDRFLDQFLRQFSAFAVGEHPADSAAAVDVDDRVKVVISPLLGQNGDRSSC
jgi:hypothetical protein